MRSRMKHNSSHHGGSSARPLTHGWGCELGRSLGAAALARAAASSLAALRTAGGPAQTGWMCPVPCPPDSTCSTTGDHVAKTLKSSC